MAQTVAAEHPASDPDDQRLRALLDVESRLHDLVHAAEQDAAERVAAARAAREERLASARDHAERADREAERLERAAHDAALAAVLAAHTDALAALRGLPESQVDELARWAISQAIAGAGEAS
jgi:hypothetical protein